MASIHQLPNTPIYLQPPERFLIGELGEWSSDAIVAWGSDKYIYLKESRINSNDGERIDAYILDQYGEIIAFYEEIAEGSAGTSLKHIRISGIEENKLYFSYMTNVWSGASSTSLKISSIELTNFENDEVFNKNIVRYASSGVDRISYSISKIHDGKVFIAYNSTTHVDSDNIIESVDLKSSTSEIILNSNYNINSISYSSNKLTYTFNDSHEYYLGSFQLAIYDTLTEQHIYSSELNNSRIWTPSSTALQDGKVVVVYAKYLGNTIFGKIYNVDGSLGKEFRIDSSDGAYDPKVLETADGGFLVSFIYTDGLVGRGQYYRDQVIVRYDKNGDQVLGTLREVTGDYYENSPLAVDQDGGVIGVSGDEEGIKSAVFLAQTFGTPGDDNILGTDDVNTIFTFDGDDTVYALDGNDYIDAGSGKNSIYGGFGTDQIWLNDGDNIIDGGPGSDWLIFGDDLPINVDLRKATSQDFGSFSAEITNVENVDSGNFNDIVIGTAFDNQIWGRDGDDTLKGGDGDDSLYGGDGDDYLEDGYGSDEVYGGAGDDTINNIGGSDLFDGGDGNDTLITDISTGFDERSFEIGFDALAGRHGRLNSDVGQDTIAGIENFTLLGNFNAFVTGGDEDNTFITHAGDDVLNGGAGDDTLSAWIGNDKVYAGTGNDTIINTGGEDLFDGGEGSDTLITDLSQSVKDKLGFSNWDFEIVLDLTANDPHMRHYGLRPDGTDYAWDEIYGIENYTLVGDFDAQLTGDDHDNIFITDSGDDVLRGGVGDDRLEGGAGNDTLEGGAGSDTFVFRGGFGHDVITDFDQVEDSLEFYNKDGTSIAVSALNENTDKNSNLVLSTSDGLSSVTLLSSVEVESNVISRGSDILSDVSVSYVFKTLSEESQQVNLALQEAGKVAHAMDRGSDFTVTADKPIDEASEDAIGAFDALQALRLAVGLTKSDGTAEWHDYLAADINKDGRVGADDALDILKFAVGLTDGAPADWIFVDGDADWSGIDRRNTDYDEGIMLEDVLVDTSINMTGILVGDLDGSYAA